MKDFFRFFVANPEITLKNNPVPLIFEPVM